ncbi:MAG: hypothetical protein ACRDHL_08325 [Candidatus Promineifilaceae bacterium]
MNTNTDEKLARLEERWRVQERPFGWRTPLIGPLLARLRQAWNDVSTTWYVRPLLQQQNEVNRLVLELLQQHERILAAEVDGRLVAADRELTELGRQLAALTAAYQRLAARLDGAPAPPEADERQAE